MGLIDRVEPWKTKLQIATFLLAVIAFAMAIGRVSSGPIQSRLDIWLIVVCIKSMIVMVYEVATEHSAKCSRFHSTKANMILNILEPLFWFTGFVLACIGTTRCRGSSCGFGGAFLVIALILVPITILLAWLAIREHRSAKALKSGRKANISAV